MNTSQPILNLATLRDIEAQQGNANPPLMERAGQAACELAKRLLNGARRPPLIVAGPGNNGGDAFVVARLLKQDGIEPVVVFAGDALKLPPDARQAHDEWLATDGVLHKDIPEGEYALAIDGLFGIGLTRPPTSHHAVLVARLNALHCPLLALDIPSGLDSETGRVLGVAIRASHTATFIALKPGLLTLDGPDHCGEISVHGLGLSIGGRNGNTPGHDNEIRSVAPDLFAGQLQARRKNSHKGSYGSVGIIGGAPGMAGAALLTGRAALQLGAGRVYLGMLERSLTVDPQQPELMLRTADEVIALATCLAIGPGLGQSAAALMLLRRAIDSSLPLLLDADALNLLATQAHSPGDVGACIASGSFATDAMVIAPCSMKTLASVAHGMGDNLLTRAADVTLKERRRLILMVRETPFNLAHLRNMTAVTEMGGIVFPPLPAFYHRPQSIDELVNDTVERVLQIAGVDEAQPQSWQGL